VYTTCTNFADKSRCVADVADACAALRARLGYSNSDARIVALKNIRDIARSGQMTLNLLDSWNRGDDVVRQVIPQLIGLTTVTPEAVEGAGRILQKTGKLSFLVLAQVQIENGLRNVCRELTGTTPRRFFATAKTVVERLGLPSDRLNPLIVSAELRNSLHGNGIHHNATRSITLGSVTYDLILNQPVRCSDWEHVAHALEHSVNVLAEVFLHPDVAKIPDPIMDHYAWDQHTTP
jgi:hypothetical protein